MYVQYAFVSMLAMVAFFHDGPNTNTANTSNALCIVNIVQPARIAGKSHQFQIAEVTTQSPNVKFPKQSQIAVNSTQESTDCDAEVTNQMQVVKSINQSPNVKSPNQSQIAVNYNQESTDCEKSGQNVQKINNADTTSRNPAYDKNKLVVIIGLVLLCLMAMLVCSHVFSDVAKRKFMQTFLSCLIFTVYYVRVAWKVKSINYQNVCGGIVFVFLGVIGIYQFWKTADIKTAGGIPPSRKGRGSI